MSFRDKRVVDLLPDYIYYMFLGRDWDVGTNKAVMGKTLNKATLSKIKVRVHNITEQKEIVQILDKVNAVIEARQLELEKLDTLIKARFVEMFGNPVANEKGWKLARLGDLATKIGSGATPKGGRESYGAEGISLIRRHISLMSKQLDGRMSQLKDRMFCLTLQGHQSLVAV